MTGKGFTAVLTGKKLVITINDITKTHGTSKSGNSEIIATSSGNVDVGNGVKLGLNVYKPV